MTRSISFGVDLLGAVGPAFWKSPHRPAAGEYGTGNPQFTGRDRTFAPDSPRTAIPMINMHPMHRDGQYGLEVALALVWRSAYLCSRPWTR